MTKSKIEWTDATWNPVTGCDRISAGCDHCYACAMAKRLKAMGQANYQNDGDPRTSGPGFAVTVHPDMLDRPLRWRKPRQVFVCSMSDLFHPDVPDEFIASVFTVMRQADQHTFQVLTKRPLGMADVVIRMAWRTPTRAEQQRGATGLQAYLWENSPASHALFGGPTVPNNVWLGTTIESDKYTFRADHLRDTPAAVRWLSLEPLLGPLPSLDLTGIDWVVVGGESGPNARPMHPDWVRDIRDRCVEAMVPFFFKQWGRWLPAAMGSSNQRWVSPDGTLDDPMQWASAPMRSSTKADPEQRILDGVVWDEYPR